MSATVLIVWLLLGLMQGLLQWPYQALSELGFRLQRGLWPLPGVAEPHSAEALAPLAGLGPALVCMASALLLWLAWGPLARGRGGGVAPLLALDRCQSDGGGRAEEVWIAKLDLSTQLVRLPLMLLTHLGGLAVGVESPSVALGASILLAIRRRWPRCNPLAQLPQHLVAVIGGAAGLGAAFRSPLLGVTYGLEELGRRSGMPLVLPVALLAGSGTLVATAMGQPARLAGLRLGTLPAAIWGWTALLTLVGAAAGALLVRLLIPLSHWLGRQLQQRLLLSAVGCAAVFTLLAILSGGLSLNDGSLSLGAALAGKDAGPPLSLLWRALATLLSLAAGAPGGLMHDTMTLGALLTTPLRAIPALSNTELAQLAAVGATALFAGAHGCPLFCAVFVFTLQGDPSLLAVLLLVSAISSSLAERWRGEGWNEHQVQGLLDANPQHTAAGR